MSRRKHEGRIGNVPTPESGEAQSVLVTSSFYQFKCALLQGLDDALREPLFTKSQKKPLIEQFIALDENRWDELLKNLTLIQNMRQLKSPWRKPWFEEQRRACIERVSQLMDATNRYILASQYASFKELMQDLRPRLQKIEAIPSHTLDEILRAHNALKLTSTLQRALSALHPKMPWTPSVQALTLILAEALHFTALHGEGTPSGVVERTPTPSLRVSGA